MAKAKPASSPQGTSPEVRDNFRELIETVVFVVVLVLLLKSFVAEAFVIPTGSMAETLYGYQKLVTCPECDLTFPVNCSDEGEGTGGPTTGCNCPSCFKAIDFTREDAGKLLQSGDREVVVRTSRGDRIFRLDESCAIRLDGSETTLDRLRTGMNVRLVFRQTDGLATALEAATSGTPRPQTPVIDPTCRNGDRVLVAKFLYDSGLRPVKRWDVGVFKFPEGPQKRHTAKNYIKRIIGLPQETIGILNGDLFVATGIDYPQPQPDADLPVRRQTHKNDPNACALLRDRSDRFTILRKPPSQMMALRRLVFDNAHQARDLVGVLPPRWAAEADAPDDANVPADVVYRTKRERARKLGAWLAVDDPARTQVFRHAERAGELAWLRYRHLLRSEDRHHRPLVPDAERKPELILDVMGYNEGYPGGIGRGENWVGDLLLECTVTVEKAAGKLVLELSKGPDRFQAAWDLTTGVCTLYRVVSSGQLLELAQAPSVLKAAGKYDLRFANFDERLTVWVNGAMPFGEGREYQHPVDQQGRPIHDPVERNDLEPASIGAQGAALQVSNLQLWRDTYYTGEPRGTPQTFYVQPGHYLCLGDNSPRSSDGRTWPSEGPGRDSQGGLVPDRLLLGRAVLVYYPPSRFGLIR